MKKQIKKLSLNKKTISNLNEMEMMKKIGGYPTAVRCNSWGCGTGNSKNCTQNQNTCLGHNTCQYTCV